MKAESIKTQHREDYLTGGKERWRLTRRRWAETHRETLRLCAREYAKRHPEQCAARVRNRNARKRGAPGHAPVERVMARVAYYGWRCWLCRAPWEAIDHVIPLARGGSNWPANLRPICRSCNSRKGVKRVA